MSERTHRFYPVVPSLLLVIPSLFLPVILSAAKDLLWSLHETPEGRSFVASLAPSP